MKELKKEIREHLQQSIIPFWKSLRDDTYGGYYGYVGYDLTVDERAVKGCILNSRITWFFANAYLTLGDESLISEARHGFEFMKEFCLDKENGGVFWSVTYDGKPEDTTKHTYNQAFSIYALSAYYDATKDEESIRIAEELYELIEEKCRNEGGYLEAFDRQFYPMENDKLSENGVIADRTMNTLLHVFESYTEFYRVTKKKEVKERLEWMMDIIAEKIYNPKLHRQEVFFDLDYHTLIDLHSYGHDIETAWLVDRGVEIVGNPEYEAKMTPITKDLTRQIYETAYKSHSLSNECEKGIVDTDRVWWVQAEAVVGFLNGYQKDKDRSEYLKAAEDIWQYIKTYLIDTREGSEWYWLLDREGRPYEDKPIVEPWKCPYHNGRMCIEVIRRDI
ncbi:AGE family epimerase/isomerase [Lachnospiraceae bacterium MD308]|nr:AGE family epimerase/isomerase [Lachnospiraceae bacterium MD308]